MSARSPIQTRRYWRVSKTFHDDNFNDGNWATKDQSTMAIQPTYEECQDPRFLAWLEWFGEIVRNRPNEAELTDG